MMITALEDAAFGEETGRRPLPTAFTSADLWLRAVAAGGQGRYAGARADLTEVLRRERRGRLSSLALSTLGSFLRQQGWHRAAAGWDGRALACAEGDGEAGVDALAGLAADALGVRRLVASAALLERAVRVHQAMDAPAPRLAVRLAWVHAELAMAGGDGGRALDHAHRSVELAAGAAPGLRRHRIKSDVVLAAALCTAGDLGGSRAVADRALAAAGAAGLVPLQWASACLLDGIGSEVHSRDRIAQIKAETGDFVTRHGGRWSPG